MAQGINPAVTPWFAEASPGLLTNKTVREYLNQYSQRQWPEVVKLTLLHGIIGLQKQYPGRTLSVAQLKQVVEKGAAALSVEHSIPALQRQVLALQQQLDGVFDGLSWTPPPGPVAGTQQPQAARHALAGPVGPAPLAFSPQHQRHAGSVRPAPARTAPLAAAAPTAAGSPPRAYSPVRASSAWRAGEPSGFPSPARSRGASPTKRAEDNQGATNPIYPDWWGDPRPKPPAAAAPQPLPRPQPRLAYSMPQQEEQPSVLQDDLVTPEYLPLGGSGYGQSQPVLEPYEPHDPLALGPSLTTVTPEEVHGSELLQAQPVAMTRAPMQQPMVPARRGMQGHRQRLASAQSKIRQQVLESRQRAAQRQQRRSQLLETAVARGAARPIGVGQEHGAAAAGAHAAGGRPASIADHFMANPWASYFMSAEEQAEQMPQELNAGASSAGHQPQPAPSPAPQRRSAFQDITAGANNSQGPSSDAETASLAGSKASGSKAGGEGPGQSRPAAWGHDLEAVRGALPQQPPEQEGSGEPGLEQQAAGRPEDKWRSKGWVGDYGHLDTVKLAFIEATTPDSPQAQLAGGGAAGGRQDVQRHGKRGHAAHSARDWVGDYGHLSGPRFSAETAFGAHASQQQQQQQRQQGNDLNAGVSSSTHHVGGSLFMSAEELRALTQASQATAPRAAHAPGSHGSKQDSDPLVALLERLERQQREAESEAAQRLAEIESDIAAAVARHGSSQGSSDGGEDDADAGALEGTSSHEDAPADVAQGEHSEVWSEDGRFLRDLAQRLQQAQSSDDNGWGAGAVLLRDSGSEQGAPDEEFKDHA